MTAFGCEKLAPKKFLKSLFQHKLYSLRTHAHLFTVLIYLANWELLNMVFLLILRSQIISIKPNIQLSNICILYTDSQLLFMSVWSQSWLHFFILMPSKKNFCISPLFLYAKCIFWFRKILVDYQSYLVFALCHRAYSKY